MDLSSSLSVDFESDLLNCWDVNDETEELPADAMDGTSGSDRKQSFVQPARLLSFHASSNSEESPSASIPCAAASVPVATPAAAAPVVTSVPNLAAAWQQGPMNIGAFNPSPQTKMTTQIGFPQYNNMVVQYALSGQATGAPFPCSVSFNRKSQDTVSNLSTTGSLTSAKDTSVMSTPTNYRAALGFSSSAVCPTLATTTTPTTNAMQFNPYMFNQYTLFASNPELLAAYQVSQLQMAAQLAAQANVRPAPAVLPPVPSPAVLPPVPSPEVLHPVPPAPETRPTPVAQAKKPTKAPPKSKKAPKTSTDATPPFLLFDAPCELRANFMQTQRMLNLPVHHDNNSYHYGMTVNGFHPQGTVDPSLSSSGNTDVKLIDSRHNKRRGAGKERNEREQKRAQKITELIEQIRLSIEDGGWKVEMKSKSQTLSKCADYVKHLMKMTKEKEEAVEKARADLEVKERKLEEDKALLEGGRSENESVTSSLTASSSVFAQDRGAQGSATKRKAGPADSCNDAAQPPKKQKIAESTKEPGDESRGGPQGHCISLGKMSSSMSDITDSNRGSSDSGGEKAGGAAHKKRRHADEISETPSTSSISSTAAVIRGAGSEHRDHGHADVVVKTMTSRARKRSRQERCRERSSLNRKFDLDYEEVFLTSNLPQIIATPAGRVVAWNKFFLKATGLCKHDVQQMTIFSIVQPDKLANLFEMVAEALRQDSSTASGSEMTPSSLGRTTGESSQSSSNAETATPRPVEYATMTLPCATFLAGSTRSSSVRVTEHGAPPLYMTVTLMPGDDVRKRLFHCVLTDCRGTDGQLGFITPELLAKYFADPEHTKLEPESRASPMQTPN